MVLDTILVVDDAPEILYLICDTILEPAGYRVLRCGDGQQSIGLAQSHTPDLLVLDLNLPGRSGLDVLQAMRDQGVTAPVIFMTSYSTEESLLRALSLGVHHFLEKPFSTEDLLNAVAAALAEVRWQKERLRMEHDLEEANRRLQLQTKAWATQNGIGRAITATLDQGEIYHRVMLGIKQLLTVEVASLYLLDEIGGDLTLQISLGGFTEQRGGQRLKPGQGVAGWVAKNGQPALIPDVKADRRYVDGAEGQTAFQTRSVLAVPLVSKDRVLGVILLINPQGGKPSFDVTDQKLLEGLAAALAVTVENARLNAKMRQTLSIETLRQLVTILSHYIGNSLTVLSLVGHALQECAHGRKPPLTPEQLGEAGATIGTEAERISRVLRIFTQAMRGSTGYRGDTLVSDIETQLRALAEKRK